MSDSAPTASPIRGRADEGFAFTAPVIFDLSNGPRLISDVTSILTPDETEAWMRDQLARRPVFASDLLQVHPSGTDPGPDLVEVGDTGRRLFYTGKMHLITGEGGRGKSLLSQYVTFALASADTGVLYLDFEKSATHFVERARLLSASPEAADRVAYWDHHTDLTTRQARHELLTFCQRYDLRVVVIDSLSRSLTAQNPNWSENSNDDIRAWHRTTVQPFLSAGLTVIVIDHMSKPHHDGGTTGRYGKGAVDKTNVVDGAAYLVRTGRPFSKQAEGFLGLDLAKDNNGDRTEGETAAEFHVTPHTDGTLTVRLLPPSQHNAEADLDAHILTWLTAQGTANMSELNTGIRARSAAVAAAVNRLAQQGRVTETKGAKGARLFTVTPTQP